MWTKHVLLPAAGLTFAVQSEDAVATPMGKGGARVKWRDRGTRREVRLGVEQGFGQLHIQAKILAMAADFGGEVVHGEGDDALSLYVIRESDPRRHVVVVIRPIDEHRFVQASIESTGADPREVRDEWAMLTRLLDTVQVGASREGAARIQVSPHDGSTGLAFDLPAGVYASGVAYGMHQLERSRKRPLGRVVFGGLAARGRSQCGEALHALTRDRGVRHGTVTEDDGLAWMRGRIRDTSGMEGDLVVGARAVRGISLVMAALVLGQEDPRPITDVMTESLQSARRSKDRAGGQPPRSVAGVLIHMTTFRRRVEDSP